MADIGMLHPVFAPIVTEPADGGVPTYGTGLVVGGSIEAVEDITTSNAELAADDIIIETDDSFVSGTITLTIDDLSDAAMKAWLGMQDATLNGLPSISEASNYEAPMGGFGYVAVKKKAGVRSYTVWWYFKTKWVRRSKRVATKPAGALEWQTPTIEGRIFTLLGSPYRYRDHRTFDNEADALACLNGLANLPINASGGLSALAMTGTGGTLSPVFGAAVRYYTFGGVSATSVTVTATAVDHTIKLYANDVYVQDLVSEIASAPIAMSIGTKKLTIIAQEAGKTSQTTEIIVVKTS